MDRSNSNDIRNFFKTYSFKSADDFITTAVEIDSQVKPIFDYYKKALQAFKSEDLPGFIDRLTEGLKSFLEHYEQRRADNWPGYKLKDLAGIFQVAYEEYISDNEIEGTPYLGDLYYSW